MTRCKEILNAAKIAVKRPLQQIKYGYFDLAVLDSAPAWKEGRVYYDPNTFTLTVYNDISNTSLQVGQEQWVRVRNQSGATIQDGKCVYITGTTGQLPTIEKAISTSNTHNQVLGLVTADITNNGFGWVTVFGNVNELNTSGLTEGQPFYLSETTAGELTSTEPLNPIVIGIVIYSHNTHGKLLVRVSDGNKYMRQIYGNIYVVDGAVSQSIPTGATYTKITQFTSDGQSNKMTISAANDKITPLVSGRYLINASCSASVGTPNVDFDFAAFVNGVEQGQVHSSRRFGSIDLGSTSLCGIVNVTAGQDIDFRVKNNHTSAVNITCHDLSLVATFIGA